MCFTKKSNRFNTKKYLLLHISNQNNENTTTKIDKRNHWNKHMSIPYILIIIVDFKIKLILVTILSSHQVRRTEETK